MLISQAEWEKTLSGYYQGDVAFNSSMKEHTSLGIGGPADVVVSPEDPVSLKNIVMLLGRQNMPFFPLGGGTNILVRDAGIEGVVIKFKAFNRIEIIDETDDYAELFVEAGVPLQKLVNFCREKGYAGMEGLIGIPGMIGGAICGNAGSYGCEIRDLLISVVVLRSGGTLERFSPEDLGFGYRTSGILADDMVLSANLMFKKDDPAAVAARTEAFFIQKKTAQPIGERSAGCVFKNPEGMSAGKMIDEAGCKGMRIGDIEVSTMHANFFVTRGQGRAEDYLTLMDKVSAKIKERFHVTLEPEIRVMGTV
ncbi:MAG: UDP-N-acetylmuramate dehydrogenase [Nitrospirota bacterium]|nr:UDP-N-acetylmuramate dehydrogenase [Nitrospirota bacterium]